MIRVDRPPNFEQILAAFPDANKPGVIFAFGEDIYNPSGDPIPVALLMHENVHNVRQRKFEKPEQWWDRYISDAEFRYTEELPAHVAEYKAQAQPLDRNDRAKLLQFTARRLVAPLYNYVPPRTLSVAMRDIRWELDR